MWGHRAKFRAIAQTGAILNIVSLKINGLRTRAKRTLLGSVLRDLQAGVCLLTGTHLRDADLEGEKYPSYNIIADYFRPAPIRECLAGGF